MFFGSVISEALDTEAAVEECLTALAEAMHASGPGGAPDVLWVFMSGHHRSRIEYLSERIHSDLPDALLVGCSASGLACNTVEVEGAPALVLAGARLPGVAARAFHLEPSDNPEEPESWRRALGGGPGDVDFAVPDAICLLTDPFTVNLETALSAVQQAAPGAAIFGAVSSGALLPGETRLLSGRRRLDRGLVGLALTGNIVVETVVAQGARPIGTPMFVTRGHLNLIQELDGKPAMAAVQGMFDELDPKDQALFRAGVLIGVVAAVGREHYDAEDFLVRDIIGYDPERHSALAIGAPVAVGDVVQFHVRDAASAGEDVLGRLAAHRHRGGPPPCGALMFNCVARGQSLYGRPGHDSAVFAATFGDTPLAGFFGNGEVGLIGGRAHVHELTASFVLFRPREEDA